MTTRIPGKALPLPPGDVLRRLYRIDIDSPSGLAWNEDRGKRKVVKAGSPAGSAQSQGRWQVMVRWVDDTGNERSQRIYSSRVVYFLHYGELPEGALIDHIDGDHQNNHPDNLRACTLQQNLWNRHRGDKDGHNVFPSAGGMWHGRFNIGDKTYQTEPFKSRLAARHATNKLRRELHGEFAKVEPLRKR